MKISRRHFLEAATVSGVVALSPAPANADTTLLPQRVLGKTGAHVSILAMGGGSRYLMYTEEDRALEALKRALDLGITYVDSSDDYGKDHLSEQRIGIVLKGRSQKPFLATKLSNRIGEDARRIVERSLTALQVSQVDLIHIHSLTTEDDLARIES